MSGITESLLVWAGLVLVVHAPWELAQLPLYAVWQDPDSRRLTAWLINGLLGDVLMATGFYLAVAMVFRDLDWPRRHARRGTLFLTAAGLAYAVGNEWYHVSLAGSWAYAPAMPRVFGIGLTPLLQWLLTPPLVVLIVRRLH